MKGEIVKSAQRVFEVCVDSLIAGKKEVILATAKGNLLKEGELVVGDLVEVEKRDKEFLILKLFERKNIISRMIVREKKTKPMASNIDLLLIIAAISKPSFKRNLIDRYLIRSAQWSVPAVVIFNKMDEHDDYKTNNEAVDIVFEEERLKNVCLGCFEISAKNKEYANKFLGSGLRDLKKLIENKTVVLLGQSGVGKSKLISALTNDSNPLLTISDELGKEGKGKHTTTFSKMIKYENLSVIDTPGIRSYSLEDIESSKLDQYFPDLIILFEQCQFSNCEHDLKSKSCYFNSLDNDKNAALFSRLLSYKKIKEEISRVPDWKKRKR